MKVINLYSSAPDKELKGFLTAMGWNLGREVQLLPLSALPAPDLLRLRALRVERDDLRRSIEAVEAHLACFGSGELQPDAGRENGLRFTLESLNTRLKGMKAVLSSVEIGGHDNG